LTVLIDINDMYYVRTCTYLCTYICVYIHTYILIHLQQNMYQNFNISSKVTLTFWSHSEMDFQTTFWQHTKNVMPLFPALQLLSS